MKIAFIVDAFPVFSETFITDQIAALIREGCEVEIFAGAKSPSKTANVAVKEFGMLDRVHLFNEKPSNMFFRAVKGLFVFFSAFMNDPAAALRSLDFFKYGRDAFNLSLLYRTETFLRYGPFDIIHCQFGTNGLVGSFLKEVGVGGKLVTTFHGYDIRKGLREGGQIYKKLFLNSDMIISISEYNRQKLLEFGADPSRIVTIPVGISVCKIDFHERSPVASDKLVRILTVGRLVEEKGLSFAINAVKGVLEERPGVKLQYSIIGGGPLEKELSLEVIRCGLEGVILFLGPKAHEETLDAMRHADIFMLSSIAEALPVSAMEAQASGLPVIATDVGSVYQIVEDGESGLLVPPGDSRELKKAIIYLIDNQTRWADMGLRGRKIVEARYDRYILCTELMDVYRQMVPEGME